MNCPKFAICGSIFLKKKEKEKNLIDFFLFIELFLINWTLTENRFWNFIPTFQMNVQGFDWLQKNYSEF